MMTGRGIGNLTSPSSVEQEARKRINNRRGGKGGRKYDHDPLNIDEHNSINGNFYWHGQWIRNAKTMFFIPKLLALFYTSINRPTDLQLKSSFWGDSSVVGITETTAKETHGHVFIIIIIPIISCFKRNRQYLVYTSPFARNLPATAGTTNPGIVFPFCIILFETRSQLWIIYEALAKEGAD